MNLFKCLFCKNRENGFKYVDLGLPSGTMWVKFADGTPFGVMEE